MADAGGGESSYIGARGLPPEFIADLERQFGFDKPPLERFLDAHTREADRALIVEVARTLDPAAQVTPLPPPHRVAAFALSELTAAFRMGVLLLLPFLVVDLLVANTLVALGLGLLSPALIALPFKLVLFLAADGFPMLLRGFARAYA
jgi:flagellar biosynthesis protein FliP